MPTFFKYNGSWYGAKGIWQKHGGVWYPAAVSLKHAGTWYAGSGGQHNYTGGSYNDPFGVSLSFSSNGGIYVTAPFTLGGTVQVGEWVTPTSLAPGSYQVYAQLMSGSVVSGTVNTWLALTSTRDWAPNGSCTLRVHVGLNSTSLHSADFTLSM